MLGRSKKKTQVSAAGIEALQLAEIDPKTAAEERLLAYRRDLMLQRQHPWQSSNRTQARMAYYALAYINDVVAESMLFEASGKDRKDNTVLHWDVELCIRELSENAHALFGLAKNDSFTDHPNDEVVFNEPTRSVLYVANALPTLPDYEHGFERDVPVDRHISRGKITQGFILALIRAGEMLQGRAYELTGEIERFPEPAPEFFDGLIDQLRNDFLYAAQSYSDAAKTDVAIGTHESLSAAYENAYNGLVSAGHVYVALYCPQILGEEWVVS